MSGCAMSETFVGCSEFGEEFCVVVVCESVEEIGSAVLDSCYSACAHGLFGPIDEKIDAPSVMGSV